MDFAEWLKTNRKREKISLRRLADKIGNLCSDAYLSQLEKRKYPGKKGKPMRPNREIVIALAEALNADVNEALVLADYAPEEKQKSLPSFLYTINFSIFSDADLKEIENFIRFKLERRQPAEEVEIIGFTPEEVEALGGKRTYEEWRESEYGEKKNAA